MTVAKPAYKFRQFIEYCIEHAPRLRNHKAFGEQMRDISEEIQCLEDAYDRILMAAAGRGQVSEMENWEEITVLVYGLYDKLARYEKQIELLPDACPYCKGSGVAHLNKVPVNCLFCKGTGKKDTP